MDIEKITSAFIRLRDARSQLKQAYEQQDKKLVEAQEKMSAQLMQFLNQSALESVKTSSGTVYREKVNKPTGADWDAIYSFIKENDAFEMLERRVKKNFVEEYMETHEGTPPPGVSVYTEYNIRIRRN